MTEPYCRSDGAAQGTLPSGRYLPDSERHQSLPQNWTSQAAFRNTTLECQHCHLGRGAVGLVEATWSAKKNPALHVLLSWGQWDPSPQGQAWCIRLGGDDIVGEGRVCLLALTYSLLGKNAERVYSLALSYSLLGEASKNLWTFQELPTNFPGTPLLVVTIPDS